MKYLRMIGLASLTLGLLACSPKDEDALKDQAASQPASAPAESKAAAMPDAGKVENVSTTATGTGATASEAVEEALKLAIKQVNGVSMDMSSEQIRAIFAATAGKDSAQLSAHVFGEYLAQQSGGVVTSFKLVEMEEPGLLSKQYKAHIEAKIAKFSGPASSQRLRIVVGPIKVDSASFALAGQAVPSDKVANEIRQQILDALTNTGRFSVLDRELSDDVSQELDMIGSGQAPSAERSKIGQAVSADLIWTGHIDAFSYNKDSGDWRIAQRVVNVANRQIQLSSILKGNLGKLTNSATDRVRQSMEAQVVDQVVSAILIRTFPITVASRDGNNVVLSQGGQSVREGKRYMLVSLGQEIKDPQTGQSLGRTEYDCCEVVIEIVSPNMSQGHLENIRMPLDQIPPGGLQLREIVADAAKAGSPDGNVASKPASKGRKVKKGGNDVFSNDAAKW